MLFFPLNEERIKGSAKGKREAKRSELVCLYENNPDSKFGASKIYVEACARFYSNPNDFLSMRIEAPSSEPGQKPDNADWASFRDLSNLIGAFFSDTGNQYYFQVNALSDNSNRIYSLQNKLDWMPQDGVQVD